MRTVIYKCHFLLLYYKILHKSCRATLQLHHQKNWHQLLDSEELSREDSLYVCDL